MGNAQLAVGSWQLAKEKRNKQQDLTSKKQRAK